MHKHSIIIIKNERNEYLQYFDPKWNSYLFLNSKMKNKNDVESICNKLKQMLEIEKEDELRQLLAQCNNNVNHPYYLQRLEELLAAIESQEYEGV